MLRFDEEIDIVGRSCADAVVRVLIKMKHLETGKVLKVLLEKASAEDVQKVFSRRQKILATVDTGNWMEVYIEKIGTGKEPSS